MKWLFSDPELIEPSVHCFARCFMCKGWIPIQRSSEGSLILGGRDCPKCGRFLNEDRLTASYAYNTLETQAIASAHKILSLDPAVIFLIAAQIPVTLMHFPIWFRSINILMYSSLIFIICRWFYRYWHKIRFVSEDYGEIIPQMRTSLLLWIVAIVLCCLLLLY